MNIFYSPYTLNHNNVDGVQINYKDDGWGLNTVFSRLTDPVNSLDGWDASYWEQVNKKERDYLYGGRFEYNKKLGWDFLNIKKIGVNFVDMVHFSDRVQGGENILFGNYSTNIIN